MIVGIELVADVDTRESFPWNWQVGARICSKARSRGVILRPLGDVIVLMPPLIVTTDEIDLLVDVVRSCLEETLQEIADQP